MTSESEAAMSQGSAISTSLINPPPIFKKYFNDQDRYISIQHQTYDKNHRIRTIVRNSISQAPQCPARPAIR
uniref:Uncharacterized protein n=1 Tax=Romanomermis culicivorax TaxID=13658 RepID=A0A915J2F2_ROMCU